MTTLNRTEKIANRKWRLRRKILGTAPQPRLSVHKSLKHIYAQIINDADQKTLVFCSSLSPEIREQLKVKKLKKREVAKLVGGLIAGKAKAGGISRVVFDRGGHRYHGRIKEVADGARAGGLQF